jgi:crossover junction endodeoxyribonuclease RuvC
VRVLGVDPGLTRCGVALVHGVVGGALIGEDIGIITSSNEMPHEQRLVHIARGIQEHLDRGEPDALAVERVFSQHNTKTVIGTAQVAGIAMMLAAERGIEVVWYTPTEVKAAVTGSGRADKAQVGFMVQRVLRLDAPLKPADAADAAAIAVCHIWRGGAQAKLQQALAGRP